MRTPPAVAAKKPRIVVTEEDFQRLYGLVERYSEGRHAEAVELLDAELARAKVVSQKKVASDVVTMRSRVVVEDTASGRVHDVTLAYPEEVAAGESRLSVLAPVGIAVLGLKAGDEISWRMPGGTTTVLRVLSVPFQPEAAGRYEL